MNERGRDALVAAALTGVKQITRTFHRDGGHCALGVLHVECHGGNEAKAIACRDERGFNPYGEVRAEFDISDCESHEIEDMNDAQHLDFLTIARKLG